MSKYEIPFNHLEILKQIMLYFAVSDSKQKEIQFKEHILVFEEKIRERMRVKMK